MSTGKSQTHLHDHAKDSQEWDQLHTSKETWQSHPILVEGIQRQGNRGNQTFPSSIVPGSSYFPFAIPTQYFEVRALPNKIMLDAEFPIPPAVGSRNLQGGCTCLTVSHYGQNFIPHSDFP